MYIQDDCVFREVPILHIHTNINTNMHVYTQDDGGCFRRSGFIHIAILINTHIHIYIQDDRVFRKIPIFEALQDTFQLRS